MNDLNYSGEKKAPNFIRALIFRIKLLQSKEIKKGALVAP